MPSKTRCACSSPRSHGEHREEIHLRLLYASVVDKHSFATSLLTCGKAQSQFIEATFYFGEIPNLNWAVAANRRKFVPRRIELHSKNAGLIRPFQNADATAFRKLQQVHDA